MEKQTMILQIVIGFCVAVVVWFGLGLAWTDSKWESINQMQKQAEALQKKNNATDKFRDEGPKLKEELAAVTKAYEETEPFLVHVENLPLVLGDIKSSGEGSGLVLTGFDNSHATYKPGLNEMPFWCRVRGRYIRVTDMLADLANHKPVLAPREVEVRRVEDEALSITLRGFGLIDLPTKAEADRANTIQVP